MSRIVVVSNPGSGSSDEEQVEEVVASLTSSGEVHAVRPASPETYPDELRAATEGADLVVVAGGDGTLNLCVNSLRDRLENLTFALIPMGTGNDLATTLGIADVPVDAVRAIRDGVTRRIDVGVVRGDGVDRLFVNACVGGFSAEASQRAPVGMKRVLGPLAYVAGAAMAATSMTRYTVRLDGRTVEQSVAAGVGNGKTVGGGTPLFPDASPEDGALEAFVLTAPGLGSALRLAAAVRGGRHPRTANAVSERSPKVAFDADPPMEFNVDGELVGLRTPCTFEVGGRMTLRVPAKATGP